MKIFLNKFILLIIFIIFALIGYQIYSLDSSFSYKDTNSYFYIVKGNGYISSLGTKKILNLNTKKEILKSGNIVSTIGNSSLGIIEWGDSSITRIGGNSKIEIKETDINKDLSSIKIRFNLLEGKSWSNVVSMFSSDSYFKEEFQDTIAGVRGTVFEVNLDKQYIYVKNHQIDLENKSGEKKIIREGEIFSLDFWRQVDEKMKDAVWQELNENIDKDYFLSLKKQAETYIKEYRGKFNINNYFDVKYKIISEIKEESVDLDKLKEEIKKLDENDKSKLYYMLMFDYQKLNVLSSDSNLFAKKMFYREVLMILATDTDKKTILKYAFYDLNDSMSSYSGANLDSIISFLSANKDSISKLGIDTSVFDFSKINLNTGNIKETLNYVNNAGKEKVNETLDSIYNFIKK